MEFTKSRFLQWEHRHTYRDNTGPIYLLIVIGGMSDMISCIYRPEACILSCVSHNSRGGLLKFYCETLQNAEDMVISLSKGMQLEILPLYNK